MADLVTGTILVATGPAEADSAAALTYAATGTHLLITSQGTGVVPTAVRAASGQTANLGEWRNSSGTARAYVTPSFQGVFEGPGTSTGNVVLGINAGATGNYSNCIVLGNTATISGDLSGAVTIGQGATAGANGAVAIGQSASSSGGGVAIGANATSSAARSMMFGGGTNATARSVVVNVANSPPANQTAGWFTWVTESFGNKPSFIGANTMSDTSTSRITS